MNPRHTIFPAKLKSLTGVREFVEAFCTENGVARSPMLRLNLVVEELFTNAVRHGHGGDSESPVWLGLERTGDAVRVSFEDTAPPFNPYARLPDESPDTTIEMRRIGGLGVLLTRELAAVRDYAYLHGRNCVRLRLAC